MLGLADEVGGDVRGIGRVVGQDHDLGGSGLGVDADDALQGALGRGDVDVAWPGHEIHRRAGGAVLEGDVVGLHQGEDAAARLIGIAAREVLRRNPFGAIERDGEGIVAGAAALEEALLHHAAHDVREIEDALGDGQERRVSQGEMINRENLGKSLVATTALRKGTVLQAHHVKARSPGQGLSPQYYEQLLGRTLQHDMQEEDFFYASDLADERVEPRSIYRFRRPWGVPVRYHDFKDYANRIRPDLFEFHLSYSDMELDPADYLSGLYEADFVVHAPELFEGSKLMDLASPDSSYRAESIRDTQRVINITRALKKFFPNTQRPMIVANIGGFSMDAPLPAGVISEYYERFARSLSELDLDGVELIPQTMAPFPWHFGGQRYQNLFVKSEEIVHWCDKLNLRMCFDISHTRLTCNHLGVDFYEFSRRISPLTAHLHLGDAQGLNGEGLQIGEGDIDFARLGKILDAGCPSASFIPEIWQGHKNGGEGFWIALEKLEGAL